MTVRVTSRRFRRLREVFFAEGRALDADPATRPESVCWICKGRIDYDAAPGTTADSHELDHVVPVSKRPDLQEDPTNFAHSHRRCNNARKDLEQDAGLGEQVPDWF